RRAVAREAPADDSPARHRLRRRASLAAFRGPAVSGSPAAPRPLRDLLRTLGDGARRAEEDAAGVGDAARLRESAARRAAGGPRRALGRAASPAPERGCGGAANR